MADGTSGGTGFARVDGSGSRLVEQLLGEIVQCAGELAREYDDLRLLGGGHQEPVLLETALIQARAGMNDALALMRSHHGRE